MSSPKKIIAVIGATGGQGGSVVKSILADPAMSANWTVRGITRDASKESSKKLASQGVEVVEANLDSKDSLVKAFQGAYAVYGVTDYWAKMDMDLEIQQGKNLADAALEAGIQHYIWSSLLNINELTHGALPHVYHFDGKAKVEAYIRTTTLPTTFMLPGFYMSNIPGSILRLSDNVWTLSMPVPASTPVPLFATNEDAGKFVKGILQHRDSTLGKRVLAATKYYTFEEVLEGFKAVYPEAGGTARYAQVEDETYKAGLMGAGMPEFAAQEMLENMKVLSREGYYGGEGLGWSHSIVKDKLTTWEEFIKTAKAFDGLK